MYCTLQGKVVKQINISGDLLEITSFMKQNRLVITEINIHNKIRIYLKEGIRQNDLLSPRLFTMITDYEVNI